MNFPMKTISYTKYHLLLIALFLCGCQVPPATVEPQTIINIDGGPLSVTETKSFNEFENTKQIEWIYSDSNDLISNVFNGKDCVIVYFDRTFNKKLVKRLFKNKRLKEFIDTYFVKIFIPEEDHFVPYYLKVAPGESKFILTTPDWIKCDDFTFGCLPAKWFTVTGKAILESKMVMSLSSSDFDGKCKKINYN